MRIQLFLAILGTFWAYLGTFRAIFDCFEEKINVSLVASGEHDAFGSKMSQKTRNFVDPVFRPTLKTRKTMSACDHDFCHCGVSL